MSAIDNPQHKHSMLVRTLRKASNIEDIHAVCSRLCRNYGFDRFVYGARIPTKHDPVIHIISGYSGDTQPPQHDEGYWRFDPQFPPSVETLAGEAWHFSNVHDQEILKILANTEKADFSLKSGISFTLHGEPDEFALLNLSSAIRSSKTFSPESLRNAEQLTHYIHEAVRHTLPHVAHNEPTQSLTSREIECLKWSADGKTAWETGQILSVTERTVTFHLRNATEKLGAGNCRQAVARAVYIGIITPHFSE